MTSTYGVLSDKSISSNLTDVIAQVFKLLPYKEDHSSLLDYHFSTVLFRIGGLSQILPNIPELITVLSLLEAARYESDFILYRKAILDSCSILKRLQVSLDEQSV